MENNLFTYATSELSQEHYSVKQVIEFILLPAGAAASLLPFRHFEIHKSFIKKRIERYHQAVFFNSHVDKLSVI